MARLILDGGPSELNVWRIGLGAVDGIEQLFRFFVIAGLVGNVDPEQDGFGRGQG